MGTSTLNMAKDVMFYLQQQFQMQFTFSGAQLMVGIELLERCLEKLYPPEHVKNMLTIEKRQRCYTCVRAAMNRDASSRDRLLEVYSSLGGYICPDKQISDEELLMLNYLADPNRDFLK